MLPPATRPSLAFSIHSTACSSGQTTPRVPRLRAVCRPGVVTIHKELDKEVQKFFVSGGFAFVHADSTADVCAVEAVPVGDLDIDAVRAGLQVRPSLSLQWSKGWQGRAGKGGWMLCALGCRCVQQSGWTTRLAGGGKKGGRESSGEHASMPTRRGPWLPSALVPLLHLQRRASFSNTAIPLPLPLSLSLPLRHCRSHSAPLSLPLCPTVTAHSQEYTAKLAALQGKGDDYEVAAAQVNCLPFFDPACAQLPVCIWLPACSPRLRAVVRCFHACCVPC